MEESGKIQTESSDSEKELLRGNFALNALAANLDIPNEREEVCIQTIEIENMVPDPTLTIDGIDQLLEDEQDLL